MEAAATEISQLNWSDLSAGFLTAAALSMLVREPLVSKTLAVLATLMLLYAIFGHDGGAAAFADEVVLPKISHMLRSGHYLGAFGGAFVVHVTQSISGSGNNRRRK